MDKQEKTSFWKKLLGAVSADPENGDEASRLYQLAGEDYTGPGLVMIVRLVLAAALIVLTTLLSLSAGVDLAILIAAACIAGYDLAIKAWDDLRHHVYLRENLLVVAAAVIALSSGMPLQGALAPLILQLVFILRDYVQSGMRRSLSPAIDPSDDGEWNDTEIAAGASIRVSADMSFPADCVVTGGSAYVDLSFLTGDEALRAIAPGSFVPAGGRCADGTVTVQIISEPEQSICAKFADALRAGADEPTEAESRWSARTKLFVPASLTLCAILLFALPLSGAATLTVAFHRVMAILVVASPCSILLTIPSVCYTATAAARKKGAVVMGAVPMEKLSDARAVVFGKSGTLTDKNYTVSAIKTDRLDPATFLKVAAHAEARSSSQAAKAILAAYSGKLDESLVKDFTEYSGGVSVKVNDIAIVLGNRNFLRQQNIAVPEGNYSLSCVHMAVDGIYAGDIELSEAVSRDAVESVHALSRCGVERVAMVTGDRREPSRRVASELAIDEYYAECSPADQGRKITDMKARLAPNSTLVFVGCPDSPDEAFRAADVGIEINALALGNGLRPADVFILGDTTAPVAPILETARSARRYIKLSAVAMTAAKALLIVLAAVGVAPLWFTLVVDACASNGLIVNALTLANEKKQAEE